MAFNISPPLNIIDLFGNWLHGVDKREKARISALLWEIWNVRNGFVFNKPSKNSLM
jgi:hypothetical protein